MQEFRTYLENKGSIHSQCTDFLAYYALPYVPKPNEHPIYQQLFKEPWKQSIISRLSNFIDNCTNENKKELPKLIRLVQNSIGNHDNTLRQLSVGISFNNFICFNTLKIILYIVIFNN